MLVQCVGYATNMPVWYFLVLVSFIMFLDVLNEGFKCCVLLHIITLLVLSFIFLQTYIVVCLKKSCQLNNFDRFLGNI